ncbi:hypothetical protein AXG93_333s1070 [Marchantia polymorpha subsp. ruderalis]|uniref:Rhodopsin n=3 Tax=Marchantia polymorpha TaxID=3197 RepID=A0A176VS52_MARPO|nr:hypothetical protein AXG93_333s1070 [Marchantia polymorpha subsp. ruderalis]
MRNGASRESNPTSARRRKRVGAELESESAMPVESEFEYFLKLNFATMSYYEDGKQPPVGVPPPQGYGYPPQGYPPQGYQPQGYPPQGYPPEGYQQQGYPPQQQMYQQQPQYQQQQQNNDRGPSFAEGCLAALCCCCLCDFLF